eukprot:TRINITY_DN4979_c3_g1_i1.p1 TRINITY_DN4979_c3_g1~~TRINITY_DN4979_c3_g1_i1.p1  ORF type:complete len:265 (-),score=79.36 TRINITY_DN4979_c3_g1_i1:42-836(-)
MYKTTNNTKSKKIGIAVVVILIIILIFIFSNNDSNVKENQKNLDILNEKVSYLENCAVGPIEQVNWDPRIFIYRNFITPEEAEYIIARGTPLLERSRVVGENSDSVSSQRTSYGAFLSTDGDPVLMNIEKKIEKWTMLPIDHGESLYLLRYEKGQEYKPHYDYFSGPGSEEHINTAGQRTVTVIIYLNEPEIGGETIFPNAKPEPIKLAPNVGDAVLFHNMKPDGNLDPNSIHGGAPVLEGTKYIITKWIRVEKFPFSWWIGRA